MILLQCRKPVGKYGIELDKYSWLMFSGHFTSCTMVEIQSRNADLMNIWITVTMSYWTFWIYYLSKNTHSSMLSTPLWMCMASHSQSKMVSLAFEQNICLIQDAKFDQRHDQFVLNNIFHLDWGTVDSVLTQMIIYFLVTALCQSPSCTFFILLSLEVPYI